MTYQAGIFGSDPHIFCDGCGLKHGVTSPRGGAYSWLLDGKAPKGWHVTWTKVDDLTRKRRDTCPACVCAIGLVKVEL
jgi:hypothetical protein